jgi:DNA-directed RNA polymerase subunit omega
MARVSIEDCLQHMENRFSLVKVAAHRARQLLEGQEATVTCKNKELVTALREVAEGKITTASQKQFEKSKEIRTQEEIKSQQPPARPPQNPGIPEMPPSIPRL